MEEWTLEAGNEAPAVLQGEEEMDQAMQRVRLEDDGGAGGTSAGCEWCLQGQPHCLGTREGALGS